MLSVPQRFLAVAALALGLSGPLSAQGVAPKDSPFLPAPFQFTGVHVAADGTRACIYAEKDQRSRWIAVGASMDGIKVVSYDADQHRAVILTDGVTRELALQHGISGAPTADSVPDGSSTSTLAAAASTPASGATVVEPPSQRDDRMLVSDLLDLSIQQRQAYANAQKAAAAPAAANK